MSSMNSNTQRGSRQRTTNRVHTTFLPFARSRCSAIAALAGSLLLLGSLHANDARNDAVAKVVDEFAGPGKIRMPIGVTPRGTYIWLVVDPQAFVVRPEVQRIVVAAAVDGDPSTLQALRDAVSKMPTPENSTVAWIPIANPDAWYDCVHAAAAPVPLPFPPRGSAYNTGDEFESAVLCRFLEWFAPDVVVEITPMHDPDLRKTQLARERIWSTDRFAGNSRGWDVGRRVQLESVRLPAKLMTAPPDKWEDGWSLYSNLEAVHQTPFTRSPTAAAACQRLQRPPLYVARRLLEVYGHKLDSVMYQPALALVARQEYGELTGESRHREQVEKILAPYLSGERPSLDDKSGGSHFAGHLVFAAWAHATQDASAIARVQAAADRAFDSDGQPREAMPTHNVMSDAVFMACPILCEAGALTGDPKYIEMASQHFTFMQQHCLRDDGLYRHSPLCEAPWGRGNGFPALGLALSLSALQPIVDQPHADTDVGHALQAAAVKAHHQMLDAFQDHLDALRKHQDPTGTWRQVIDHPGAYRELTATCMLTFAIARGLRMGWLDAETYRPIVDRAWEAIQLRVYDDGVLIDVCTGTGKQKSLQDYLNREAILGRDERGGAMALLAALEMHRLLTDE